MFVCVYECVRGRAGVFVRNPGLYLPSMYAKDRFCGCVFGRVGECDCESGSTKRICACVLAVSPLLLLVHLNSQRWRWGVGGFSMAESALRRS